MIPADKSPNLSKYQVISGEISGERSYQTIDSVAKHSTIRALHIGTALIIEKPLTPAALVGMDFSTAILTLLFHVVTVLYPLVAVYAR
jgi:hypothetical protein